MTKAMKLKNRILHDKPKDKNGWLDLEKEVIDYFDSDASDDDKKELSKYTEMLLMVCNGIRSRKA